METWAVDLADVGAVYPWQGAEVIMVIAGVVFWLWWHIAQMKAENEEFKADIAKHGSDEQIRRSLEKHY